MEEKSLLEFIKALDQLNGANLHYLTGRDASWYELNEKYREELEQVMDLINSFEFVRNQPPMSNLIRIKCFFEFHEWIIGDLEND